MATEMVPRRVLERRAIKKFGDARNDSAGPNQSTTIIGEPVYLTLSRSKEEVVEEVLKLKSIQCRICSGEHFSIKCPYKDSLVVEKPKEVKSDKYRPPCIRMGIPETHALRVSNLPEATTEQDLRAVFDNFGRIVRLYLATDQDKQRCLGYGFVNFESRVSAQKALDLMNGRGYGNLIMHVEWAKVKQ